MQVLIPAGGRGVRLRPLTNDTPKPLLPLGDRPILTRIVEDLPTEFPANVLVTPELETQFAGWRTSLCGVRPVRLYVERPRVAGPPGPVVALSDCLSDFRIEDDLLIMMGDSIHPFAMADFLATGSPDELRIAAYQLPDIRQAGRFGVLELGPGDRLASFEEKPEQPRSPWIFTGCMYVPRRAVPLLHEIAAQGLPQMGHLVARYLEFGETVRVFRATGEWHDIGTFQSYLAAHQRLLSSECQQNLLSTGNSLDGVVYVHPAARVSGSRLRDCIVSAGADIADADLTSCVVQAAVSIRGREINGKLIGAEAELPLF